MLRMGLPEIARDYLKWYTDHALHDNGLVSPILNNDGTVNTASAPTSSTTVRVSSSRSSPTSPSWTAGRRACARTCRRPASRCSSWRSVRERTLVPDYQRTARCPSAFAASSPRSAMKATPSHAQLLGRGRGLKGWHDGAWLAGALGDVEMETWAHAQYDALKDSFVASMDATMAWKGMTMIPASADKGDTDPTSISIGIDPCGLLNLYPHDALKQTFDGYLADVRKRAEPGSLWAYTPYELRNVLTFVRLNQPKDAFELLTHLMRDRRPPAWQMFAEVVHSRLRHPGYMGDMPHTWIGAEYVRLVLAC